MNQVSFYEVSTTKNNRRSILFSSLSQDEAQNFARQYYADNQVICEIHVDERIPVDHTK